MRAVWMFMPMHFMACNRLLAVMTIVDEVWKLKQSSSTISL